MKILLLGSTGRTGKLVIEEAIRRGHKISAIARDPEKLKDYQIDITLGTPYDFETVEKAISGCEAVINTLNVSRKSDNPWAGLVSPKNLISKSATNAVTAMKEEGIKRFIALSTIGAGSSW
jgi:putative NADH-flavin reductase